MTAVVPRKCQAKEAGERRRRQIAEDQDYLVSEAFEVLRCQREKGYRLINSGELESYKIGRIRYVSRDAIRKLRERKLREAQS